MKKTLNFLSLSLLIFCGSASAANLSKNIALWEQVNRLSCLGQTISRCTESGCSNNTAGITVWNVDFTDMLIEFYNVNTKVELVGTSFENYPTRDTSKHVVFLGDGRFMRFNLDNLDEFNRSVTKGIQAAVSSIYWTENEYKNNILVSSTTSFECYEQ